MHSGINDNAVTYTVVSMTPLCKYDTAVTLDLIFQRLWLPSKAISFKKTYMYIGKLSLTYTQRCGSVSLNFFTLWNRDPDPGRIFSGSRIQRGCFWVRFSYESLFFYFLLIKLAPETIRSKKRVGSICHAAFYVQ
jgi:hypothetical protein